MDIDGIWSLEFTSTLHDGGTGVLILENGRAFGADAAHHYAGTYSADEDQLVCNLTITHDQGQCSPLISAGQAHVVFTGTINESRVELTGRIKEGPHERLIGILTKRAALPATETK